MLNFFNPDAPPPTPRQIASNFRIVGWVGFWLQALLGAIPILVLLSRALFVSPQRSPASSSPGLFLPFVCLAVLVFSIYWCFRYTRIGAQLVDPELRPAKANVVRDLQIGLIANLGITTISVLIAMGRVAEMTYKLLSLPQGAVAVSRDQSGAIITQGSSLIAPSGMVVLQSIVNTIAAGLVGIIVALWLLYQVGQHRNSR